jgi:MFS family permease
MNEPPSPRDPYAALRFYNFRLLIFGRFCGQIAEAMISVAVGWELYERTRDPFALGLVGLVQVIPVLLLSLFGGYMADTYDRRRITLYSQWVLVGCAVGLLLVSLNQSDLVILYGLLAVVGVAKAFNNPAEGALTPQTVPPEFYYSAATFNSAVWQLSAIMGPAAAGLLIAFAGNAAPVYVANILGGLIFIVTLMMLKLKSSAEKREVEPPLQSLREGVRFLRNTPLIVAAITLDMFAVLFGGAVFLLPVFASDILRVDSTGLGILRAAPSVGALLMAAYLSRRGPFRHSGRVLLLAVAGFGLATIGFGLSQSFWLSVLLLGLTGALDNISVVIRSLLIYTYTPDAMRGRVNSVNMIFIGASNELGGFQSGVAGALLGAVGAVVFGGTMSILVVGLIAWFSPELRRMDRIQKTADPVEDAAAVKPA